MKQNALVGLIIGSVLVGTASLVQALTIDINGQIAGGITEVGNIDNLLFSEELGNAGDPDVTTWINNFFSSNGYGSGYTLGFKDNNLSNDWYDVYNGNTIENKVYAYDLANDTEFFLLKIGTGSLPAGTADHYLFQNLDSLNYAVISLSAMGLNVDRENVNIGRVSHVTEIAGTTPVPEPATMLLFGTGLAGLAGFARRQKKD